MGIPTAVVSRNPRRIFVGFELLLLLLLLAVSIFTTNAGAARIATPPAPSPAASVVAHHPPSTTPTRKPAPSSPSSSSSALDPKQLSALQSMNLPTSRDPCTLPAPHNYTSCDSASPFQHVLSLSLTNCSSDLELSSTALRALSPTLRSLSFDRCPIPPPRIPAALISTLRSFSATASLKHLTGVYLSRLANLTDLSVVNVPVNASGPWIIISRTRQLRRLTITGANLTGGVPRHWHVLNLTSVDLSHNRLRGTVPASIGRLTSLEYLDLSSNELRGPLPDTLSNLLSLRNASFASNSLTGPLPDTLTDMPALAHLDISGNRFNGTIPRFLANMRGLTHLNLENNQFRGVLPFNASFIGRLLVLRLEGNSDLCYNRTVLSSKLKLGIAPCDKYGMPIKPPSPPVRKHKADSSRQSSEDEDFGGGSGHHGPSKVVLGVAIGLSCLVFLIVFMVCLSKCCG